MKFKLRQDHHPEDLDGGRVLAPGDEIDLNTQQAQEPKAAQLIADGLLLPATRRAEQIAAHVTDQHPTEGGEAS